MTPCTTLTVSHYRRTKTPCMWPAGASRALCGLTLLTTVNPVPVSISPRYPRLTVWRSTVLAIFTSLNMRLSAFEYFLLREKSWRRSVPMPTLPTPRLADRDSGHFILPVRVRFGSWNWILPGFPIDTGNATGNEYVENDIV